MYNVREAFISKALNRTWRDRQCRQMTGDITAEFVSYFSITSSAEENKLMQDWCNIVNFSERHHIWGHFWLSQPHPNKYIWTLKKSAVGCHKRQKQWWQNHRELKRTKWKLHSKRIRYFIAVSLTEVLACHSKFTVKIYLKYLYEPKTQLKQENNDSGFWFLFYVNSTVSPDNWSACSPD